MMMRLRWITTITTLMMLLGAGTAQAQASISFGPAEAYTYSTEGLALTGTGAVTLPDIVVTLGNDLTYQDDIFLTLPGAVAVQPTITSTLVTCGVAGLAMGYVETVAGGWYFRVTSVTGITVGDVCAFTGLQVQANSLSAAADSVQYRATRFVTGQLLDSAESDGGITVRSQFGVTVEHALNGVIDVYKDRLAFEVVELVPPGSGAAWPDQADTLNFTTTRNGAGTVFNGPVVSTVRTTVLISGDFGWVDGIDAGTTCEPTEFAARVIGVAEGYVVGSGSNCQQLELTSSAADGSTIAQTYFYVPRTARLTPTTYTGTVRWDYALVPHVGITGATTAEWDPGSWSTNGALVYIRYMPYGEGVSRIVYAANRALNSVGLAADVYHDSSQYFCRLDPLPGRAVTQLSAALDACVAEQGITRGRVAFLLTFRAADRDIEVYSAYNVGGSERGTVVNTSNGRRFFYGPGF